MAAATTVGTGHPSMPMTLLVMEITQQKSNGEWKTITLVRGLQFL